MTTGWFQGRRLEYNDTVTYRLYYVLAGDILSVEPSVDTRQRARLARRERDVPVPDTPDALAATLTDWGAEHRPQEPCSACGCTLYWTAAGDLMCAICLPMPRLTEQSRERIARLFPRTSRGHGDRPRATAADAWSKPPQPDGGLRKGRQGRSL
jgi:hypothetical protein